MVDFAMDVYKNLYSDKDIPHSKAGYLMVKRTEGSCGYNGSLRDNYNYKNYFIRYKIYYIIDILSYTML